MDAMATVPLVAAWLLEGTTGLIVRRPITQLGSKRMMAKSNSSDIKCFIEMRDSWNAAILST